MSDACHDDHCTIDHSSNDANDDDRFGFGPGKHVAFFGDPMCSWCWGFAPVLNQIRAAIQGRAQFHMVMGGLRPGTRETWDAKMRDYISGHWHHVQDATGQPFDFSRFEDASFVYDTEPPCRALVAVRGLAPERAPDFYEAMQRAFYALGQDITHADALARLAQAQGVDEHAFRQAFTHDDAHAQVLEDFQRTRAFGVSGFPSVLCAEDGRYGFLTLGYRPFSDMAAPLEEWLNA